MVHSQTYISLINYFLLHCTLSILRPDTVLLSYIIYLVVSGHYIKISFQFVSGCFSNTSTPLELVAVIELLRHCKYQLTTYFEQFYVILSHCFSIRYLCRVLFKYMNKNRDFIFIKIAKDVGISYIVLYRSDLITCNQLYSSNV